MTATHNWNYLEIVDRASGEVERIHLDDKNAAASVEMAAQRTGCKAHEIWDLLLAGGQHVTAAFVRQLA